MKDRLEAVARRLNQLAVQRPDARRGRRGRTGLAARILRRLYGRPRIDTTDIGLLVRHLGRGDLAGRDWAESQPCIWRRRCGSWSGAWPGGTVQPAAPAGFAGAQLHWLWRLYQILYRAQQLAQARRGVLAAAPAAGQPGRSTTCGRCAAAETAAATIGGPLPWTRCWTPPDDEVRRLGRKRRLLEAARQFLLDAAAASPLDPAAVRDRRVHIAQELAQLDRLQAAGLSPDVDLLYQARQAQGRGDRLAPGRGAVGHRGGCHRGPAAAAGPAGQPRAGPAWGGSRARPLLRGGADRIHASSPTRS